MFIDYLTLMMVVVATSAVFVAYYGWRLLDAPPDTLRS